MYIERIIGKVTDNEKNGTVLNPPVDGGYYIINIKYRFMREHESVQT